MKRYKSLMRDDEDCEPPRKQSKLNRTVKTIRDDRTPNLCDLPIEILQMIIGNVNIWHHNRIRSTSRRLHDACDGYILHEFNKTLHQRIKQDADSYECAVLRVIKQATEIYVHSGYASVFCGCMLLMLREAYREKPFCPQKDQINTFLHHFYNCIDEVIGDYSSQHARMLYNLTLMRFFKHFEKSSVVSSKRMALHWRIVVEVRGPWLGMLWNVKTRAREQPTNRSYLLIVLTDMLLSSITGDAFKKVWEASPLSEIYVFGNDTSDTRRTPKSVFTFTVNSSHRVCSLFRSCLEGDPKDFQWPARWPKDQFTVNLDIVCTEAAKWGCSKSHHMEFGPYSDQKQNEEEEYMADEVCSSVSTLLDMH